MTLASLLGEFSSLARLYPDAEPVIRDEEGDMFSLVAVRRVNKPTFGPCLAIESADKIHGNCLTDGDFWKLERERDALQRDLEKSEAKEDALESRLLAAEDLIAALRTAIVTLNHNRAVEDLHCPACGAQAAVHELGEEHPGVFRCRECHRGILA